MSCSLLSASALQYGCYLDGENNGDSSEHEPFPELLTDTELIEKFEMASNKLSFIRIVINCRAIRKRTRISNSKGGMFEEVQNSFGVS